MSFTLTTITTGDTTYISYFNNANSSAPTQTIIIPPRTSNNGYSEYPTPYNQMTRKEEIREIAIKVKEDLKYPHGMNLIPAVTQMTDLILELTAPESAPVEESQDSLWEEFYCQ